MKITCISNISAYIRGLYQSVMNVLMVIERYIPIWGGAENQLRQLIPHLENRGCTIKIVTRRWHKHLPQQEKIDGTEVVRVGVPGTGVFSTIIFVQSLIIYIIRKNQNIDILHSHGAANMGALCSLLAKFLGLSTVAKIATAGKVLSLQNNLLGRFNLWLFKRSDAVIAMTEEIEQELININTPANKIIRITNGVDTSRFIPISGGEREKWRNEQGVSTEAQIVLFSSRLVYRKGLDILLAAWPEVSESCPGAILMILGSGKGQPDSVEEEIKSLTRDTNINNVIFLGESDHPEFFLGAADVFVFPSRKEGFPNALMEAMSAALPVVASNIGGVTPLIKDHETGLIFDLANKHDLVINLKIAIKDHELRNKIGNNARTFMSNNFNFTIIADRYYELYCQISPKKLH